MVARRANRDGTPSEQLWGSVSAAAAILVLALVVVPPPPRLFAQVILPETVGAPASSQTDPANDAAVPDGRIERMLVRLSSDADPRLRSLNLQEYVVVIGEAPDLPLFGHETDLTIGGGGAPNHAEIAAIAAPADVRQAGSMDALGIATASLSMVAPAAARALFGWLAGDDSDAAPQGPRYAAYTGSFHLTDGETPARSAVPFYRSAGQPVSISVVFAPVPREGVLLAVNDATWGVFLDDIDELGVPEKLLPDDRRGDVHRVELTRPAGSGPQGPIEVDVVVVVYGAPAF